MPNGAATQHLYRPKLLSTLAEGYGAQALRRDAVAGLTVAVVALPLSMAIGVASGIGLILAALVAAPPAVHVETLGSRFGDLPRGLPAPAWPPLSWPLLVKVFPTALAFTCWAPSRACFRPRWPTA
jgi:MFS superfamily sulfate permease-like transporter